jgi:hypothetical protein
MAVSGPGSGGRGPGARVVPGAPHGGGDRHRRGETYTGFRGSLERPGPLPMHLHTVYMEYSERLPTLLNPPG